MQNQHCKKSVGSLRRGYRALLLGCLVLTVSAARAQHLSSQSNMDSLPDAPTRDASHDALVPQPNPQAPDSQSSATISGTVLDIREGLVPDARVSLQTAAGVERSVETSDASGAFLFTNVPPGTYRIRITSPGLESFLSYEIILRPGEHYVLPRIALPIAAATTDVQVTVTEDQIATEQIHAEIEQRAFGVFPNFYTSFLWNAAPLKTRHKFYLALRSTTDPVNFITTSIVAGIQQANNTYAGYGDGIEGYAKRYGADYGNEVIARMVGGAILPSLFRQDPRYFYQGTGGIRSRTFHAIDSTFVCRGDNGHSQPNFSYVLGAFASAGITNLYYPDSDRTAQTVVENVLIRFGAHSANNLIREFVLRKITTKVPTYATGKPVSIPTAANDSSASSKK